MRGALLLATMLAACGGPVRADGAVDDDAGSDAATASDAAADAAQDAGVDGGADAGELDGGDGGPPGPLRVVKLSDHCALRSDGDVRCWGEGREGQLGNGELVSSDAAVRAQLPGPASDVGCAGRHCCAIVDGGVWCWGDNGEGQVGRPFSETGFPYLRPTPVRAVYDGRAVLVAAGALATCVVDDAGAVWCWGRQITEATAVEQHLPRRFHIVDGEGPTRIDVGGATGCVIATHTDGERGAFCFGVNDQFQAGSSAPAFYVAATYARPCTDVMRVFRDTLCVSAGELFCWGSGGCLGRGFGTTSAGPLDGFSGVARLGGHCIFSDDGTVLRISSGAAAPLSAPEGTVDAVVTAAMACVTTGAAVLCNGVELAGVMD